MRGVKDFLKDSLPAMIDYILVVSTPAKSESYAANAEDPTERHERLAVVNALRHRTSQMPVLNRESIPMPLIPDIPKQLAIITSAVIRNSRDYHSRAKPNDPSDRPLNEFSSRCFDVEESALQRVSQLAARISSDRRRPEHSPSLSASGSPSTSAPKRTRKSSGRPSTAPSPSDPNYPARRLFFRAHNAVQSLGPCQLGCAWRGIIDLPNPEASSQVILHGFDPIILPEIDSNAHCSRHPRFGRQEEKGATAGYLAAIARCLSSGTSGIYPVACCTTLCYYPCKKR